MRKLNEVYEVEIVYKRPAISLLDTITCQNDAIDLFRKILSTDKIDFKEFFMVALLNHNHNVLGVSIIGIGNTNATCVNIKEIFQLAIKTNSSGIILCHNHPSGNLKPSESDLSLTRRIKEVCKFCDINLLDHLIITSEGYYSFIEEI